MDEEKKLVKVVLVFEDGSTKDKKPRETLAEARERLENVNKEIKYPKYDVLDFLKEPANKLGAHIDIAYKILRDRGYSNDYAWDLINNVIKEEAFK